MDPWLTVVGIGEDGWDGLGAAARRAVREAPAVMGGARHLALLPEIPGQARETWPSPFADGYDRVMARRGSPLCVLASGDPMFFGLGASLARRLPAAEMRVFPAPSCVSLAAARLGWALHETATLPLHGRPLAALHPLLHDGARLLLLAENRDTPARVAALLTARGFGGSAVTVLEHLGGLRERRFEGRAAGWPHPPGADLAVIAVTCAADGGTAGGLSRLAGLPDDAFDHDGQITKRDQRAVTLARLAPRPGELVWDVGAGCGSIGIEWMRTHPACRAIAVEPRADRRDHIARNREALGVPGLVIVPGEAPAALEGLEPPDAVFIGGGVTADGVFDACWTALKPGGRLVANAVTLEGEAMLTALQARLGGALTRLSVAHAAPLGGFHGWRPAMPVTLLALRKPSTETEEAPTP
ncbi:precorrin-6y C5,15-methyltransferase (decarboxylating) subunit CbiE [Roseospira goensis]|uniref:Precorrin-6Y C5,15-methyltransferase (Decarboxylating) n=1 Tax=Roseospira goensis TaxID=391922 RepID=A0A7W6WL58_9PROT|nr:precorrin-6y C5,15-methyltransferase (decarboxylating) subunit CbiE [Roseospira goensis]MBB4286067.1 precorrin-6Y C5,15-methyltransferase (decarboxylating) [Roseospira goensis]